jgi:ATP-dependent exoDNAse (exonuclease V) beta subunit
MIDQGITLQEDAASRARALALSSFIVEAPAGAGKTELLTQRFLKLLQTVDEPEEIIAITFTNKAAAEMRLRIFDSLINAAKEIEPLHTHKKITYDLSLLALQKSRDLGWNLLENPSRLRIFTIDGLCAYLARQMPLMSRFGAQPRIADDALQHYSLAAERTLDLIDKADLGEVVKAAMRYLDNDANKLTNLLVRMLSMRDQWLHHTQQSITPEQLQATLRQVVGDELVDIAKVLKVPIQHALMPLARYAANHLPCEHRIALLRDWETYLPTHAESLAMWQSVADLLLTGKSEIRKTVTVNEGFPAEGKVEKQLMIELLVSLREVEGAQKALSRIRVLPGLNNHQSSWEMVSTFSKLLNLAAAQLWLVFQQAREVDFGEVAQRAVQALSGEHGAPTDLSLRLDYHIKHLLVDEFQDTSPSQVQLLEMLTQGWQEGDGRTLFAVGDPMQSIYRFRKANVGLFLSAAQYGIGSVPLANLRLSRNNRSCPPVIDWINQCFNSVFPTEDNVPKGTIRYRHFIATKPNDADTGVEIHPIFKLADETVDAARQREAEAIINIIQREQTLHPKRKIAILVRAKTHLRSLVAELRRNHKSIQFQAVEIEALTNRQIVQDLLSLTRALHHRADRVNWLAVLRAPWCGLRLEDLHALAWQDHYGTIWSLMQNPELDLSPDGMDRISHVKAVFSEAFAMQGRVSTSRWVRGVWLMLGGASCLWEESDVIDVQAFFDCIDKLDQQQQFTLAKLTQEIDKLFAAPDINGEHLQMMTIHKSKGLEFDTVILPGLGNAIGGNDEPAALLWEELVLNDAELTISHAHHQETSLLAAPFVPKGLKSQDEVSPYDYLNILEKERAANEDARILYVAATRAERKLHLVGVANQAKNGNISPTKNTYLDMLWPVVEQDYLSANLWVYELSEPKQSIGSFVPKLVRLAHTKCPEALREEIASDQLQIHTRSGAETLGNKQTVALAKCLDADIGTLAHRYLEIIAKQGLDKWSPAHIEGLFKTIQVWFVRQGYSQSEANIASLQVQKLLITTLNSEQGRWILERHSEANAELSMVQFQQAEVKTYVIDRTFIESKAGTKIRWIVDYKTVMLTSETSQSALLAIANQHSAQLGIYAQLFKDEGLEIRQAVFFLSIGKLVLISNS